MKQSVAHAAIRRSPDIAAGLSWPAPVAPGKPRDILAELQKASELITSTVNELEQRRELSQTRALLGRTAPEKRTEQRFQLAVNGVQETPADALGRYRGYQQTRSVKKGSPTAPTDRDSEVQCAISEVAASLSAILAEADKKTGQAAQADTCCLVIAGKVTSENLVLPKAADVIAANSSRTSEVKTSRSFETDTMCLQISRLTEEITKLRQERAGRPPVEVAETKFVEKTTRWPKRPRLSGNGVVGPVIVSLNHVAGIEEAGTEPTGQDAVLRQGLPEGEELRTEHVSNDILPAKPESSPVWRSHSSVLLRLAAILILIGAGEGIRRFINDQPERQASLALSRKAPDVTLGNDLSTPDTNRDVTATGSLSNGSAPQLNNLPSEKREEDELRQAFSKQTVLSESRSFEAALAAGNPRALFDKAIYLTEAGDQAGLAEAALLYNQAAEKDFAPAQFRLGMAYEKGLGVPVDKAKAAALYERAARGGNIKAMHNLATLKASSQAGGRPDYLLAAQWFKTAAERGLSDSQYNYALLAARGLGMPQNPSDAFKYLSLAARQGDADAALRRDQIVQMLSKDEIEAVERDIAAFSVKTEVADANEKTLPPPPWLERDWFTQRWFRKNGQGA